MDRDIIIQKALKKAFPGIPEEESSILVTEGSFEPHQPGARLTIEGNIEHTFYILLEGDVKVTKMMNADEDRLLKYLGPGDFFGEMALIHEAPRAATITAITDVSVLAIDKEAFDRALNTSPSIAKAMVREVSRRLRENDDMAIEDLRLKASELAAAYHQLAELERARREFLTTIAHELRTPLASASGYMQIINLGMMEGETLKSGLGTVARNIDQIVSLTNDILFLQEMDLILSDFEPVDIGNIVTSAVDAEKKIAEENGVGYKLNIAPNLPDLPGDAKSLERAFRAIINNAFKFSINGGEVSITVDQNPVYVWAAVRDSGIGIPPDVLNSIWERFWRTEEYDGHLFGGVGLGLPIAKQVIEQHGGQIEVKSTPGEGTTFTIRLRIQPLENAGKKKQNSP
ncbi:MAG: cyclic nucleotide-binding domain-containing protein [Anaerolineae bacterium]|nr:MAG: cyclic nucleotide-binding domain-containing protein [Anaerolineae bacterium]